MSYGDPPCSRGGGCSLFWRAAVVAALAGVIALDRPAAADWDEDCLDPNQVYNEADMPTALNLESTDVVLFESGTYTGTVQIQTTGATICVAGPANFNPTSFNGSGRLFVRGTATLPALSVDAQALLDNEGTVTFLAQVNVNGIATVINRVGATITLDTPNLALGSGATVTNDGTITVNGSVNLNGSTVTNNNALMITGALTMTGNLTNTGQMTVQGQTTLNGGSQVTNTCSFVSNGLINNGAFTNEGVVDVGGAELLMNGGGSFNQTATGIATGGNFTNNGAVSGTGQYLFSGTTVNQGTMTGESPASPIVFYDTTSTNEQIFDTNNGTVTNVVRQVVEPPASGVCSLTPPTTTTTTLPPTTTSTTLPPTTTSTRPRRSRRPPHRPPRRRRRSRRRPRRPPRRSRRPHTTTTTTLPPTTTSTTTTTLPPTTTSTTTTTLPPTTTSTTTTTLPPTTSSSTSTSSTTTSSTTTSTTDPGSVSPTGGDSSTTTTSTSTTDPRSSTTRPDPPYVGPSATLPSTGGGPPGDLLAAATACALAGAALVFVARPRRR